MHSKVTTLCIFLPTGHPSYGDPMTYRVTLRDRSIETVDDADAFSHERLMTTFYRTGNQRRAVDCWAVPLASFRTEEILMIRQAEPSTTPPFSG